VIPGHSNRSAPITMSGHFAGDFTVAQLKQLAAVQPMAGRDHAADGAAYRIVTLPEMLAFHEARLSAGSASGLYMELKHPAYHLAQVCVCGVAWIVTAVHHHLRMRCQTVVLRCTLCWGLASCHPPLEHRQRC
jgi:hypothetical protein